MYCEMRKRGGYCRIDNRICMGKPIEGKKRIIEDKIFVELEYPNGCPMLHYLNMDASIGQDSSDLLRRGR